MKRLITTGISALALLLAAACGSTGQVGATGNWTMSDPDPNSATSATNSAELEDDVTVEGNSATTQTFTETVANRNGVTVFADNRGSAVLNGRDAIPGGTSVEVTCYTNNLSGMSSVNYFYLIKGGEWDGKYAPANVFDNGGPPGNNGINLDPRVSRC